MTQITRLRPGDYFLVTDAYDDRDFRSFLTKGIRFVTRRYAADKTAYYTHGGIIVNEDGTTYEALTTYKFADLFRAYGNEDSNLLIVRHKEMTPERHATGMNEVLRFQGHTYPVYRLVTFLWGADIPRYLYAGRPVCTELLFMHTKYAGCTAPRFRGIYPDKACDIFKGTSPYEEWASYYEIIFEGSGRDLVLV